MDYAIRPLAPADEPFLWEMLYQAIYVGDGEPPPREILNRPDIAHYVKGWGQANDVGFIAEVEGQPIGAVWSRLLTGENHGYGYVDDSMPELSMALMPEYRGQGIGSALLTRLLAEIKGRYPAISLSVAPENPAKRLYERMGFEAVGQCGTSLTMRKIL